MTIAAGHMGWYAHREYAEGFVRERAELLSRTIVLDAAFRDAADSRMEALKRITGESCKNAWPGNRRAPTHRGRSGQSRAEPDDA
ncbi:MAG: hypothetical protein HOC74_00965 [Gemmatimonadetes bacterium]|nr:hypothetical protein [Gemmatimonadota bacterium]